MSDVPKAEYIRMCGEADREMLRAEAAEQRLRAVRELAERWLVDRDMPNHLGRELVAILTRE